MSADFSIVVDRPRNLLDVTMSGFYVRDDVLRYQQAIHATSRELGGDFGRQRMISDITGMRIQPQETVVAFGDVMADPRYAGRKVAFVVTASLARMQLQRAMAGRHARLFATRADAEAWLFADDRVAA